MKVTVLGAGGWGTALAMKLFEKGYDTYLWSAFDKEVEELNSTHKNRLLQGVMIPDGITITSDLDLAMDRTELVVIAVPSSAVKDVCKKLLIYNPLPVIVCVSKGFDEDNGDLMGDVIGKILSTEKIVILSGPTHAEEVSRDIPTAIVAASEIEAYAKFVQNVFMSENFRVYTNTDVVGVEVSGALKNVIALCAGISDGCGYGDNTKAALMTRGLSEIAKLGVAMGGRFETFMGLTGVGDLIVTCTSVHSRNRRAGILIGKGMSAKEAVDEVKMVVEGIKSCKSAYLLSKKYNLDLPIIKTAYDVLFNNVNPRAAVTELMLRDKKSE